MKAKNFKYENFSFRVL